MKTSELIGPALDWAVAKCEGAKNLRENPHRFDKRLIFRIVDRTLFMQELRFSTDWARGGPIIEREGIEIRKGNPLYFPSGNENGDHYEPLWLAGKMHGQTLLIAAMRCYVASKLGNEVAIPKELL